MYVLPPFHHLVGESETFAIKWKYLEYLVCFLNNTARGLFVKSGQCLFIRW